MKMTHSNTIVHIMEAIEKGASVEALIQQFPEQRAVIQEIKEMQGKLTQVAATIPEPVTIPEPPRLLRVEGPTKRSFLIPSFLFHAMNYRIVVPALMIGLAAIGGTAFYLTENRPVVQTPLETPIQQEKGSVETTNDTTTSAVAPQEQGQDPAPSASSVDDVLVGFSNDMTSEQRTSAEDEMAADMFAQSELSTFESETYDF